MAHGILEGLPKIRKDGWLWAIDCFKTDFHIDESDYMETVIHFKPEHTSPLWKLGKIGGAAVGGIVGAACGISLGAIIKTLVELIHAPALTLPPAQQGFPQPEPSGKEGHIPGLRTPRVKRNFSCDVESLHTYSHPWSGRDMSP
jgi:hypothetical protein